MTFSSNNNYVAGFKALIAALEPRYTLPSDSHFRKTVIPELYESLCVKLQAVLDKPKFLSFTTDAWTTAQCTDSLLSITAHWIDNDWQRQSAIVGACHMEGSHTGANIATLITTELKKWSIITAATNTTTATSRVHVFLRDNGKNMVTGLRDAGVLSLSCLSHTFQLSVNRGLKSQRAVMDLTAIGRSIVGHFSHSVKAKDKLKEIQSTIPNMPAHNLLQDVSTRWNSTYYMLERLVEQKKSLVLYAADTTIDLPTNAQWTLMERVVALLAPIERATRDVSADSSCVSDVIPMVIGVKRALAMVTDDSGVQTMKKEIIDDITSRFDDINTQPLYVVATMVDPRYRGRLFQPADLAVATGWLTDEAERCPPPPPATETSTPVQSSSEPPAKRQRTEVRSPLDLLDDVLQASDESDDELTAAGEVAKYLRETNIPRTDCPLAWWKINSSTYPRLSQVAKRFLSAPSTSVPSERLFSSAGDLYSDTRNRLAPERAEMLLFIKKNISLL